MTKTIVLDAEKLIVLGVYADMPKPVTGENLLAVQKADDLRPLSSSKLVQLFNMQSSDQVNKFTDKATATTRVFKLLDGLEIEADEPGEELIGPGDKPATDDAPKEEKRPKSTKQRIRGQRFAMLPGWEEKRFNEGSQRSKCFEVVKSLTSNGTQSAEVDDYIAKAQEETGLPESNVMACLCKLIDKTGQQHPTVQIVQE